MVLETVGMGAEGPASWPSAAGLLMSLCSRIEVGKLEVGIEGVLVAAAAALLEGPGAAALDGKTGVRRRNSPCFLGRSSFAMLPDWTAPWKTEVYQDEQEVEGSVKLLGQQRAPLWSVRLLEQ